jgi:hypothetical protein
MAKNNVAHVKISRNLNGTEIYMKSEVLHALMKAFSGGNTGDYYFSDGTVKKIFRFHVQSPDIIYNYSGDVQFLLISTELDKGVTVKINTPTTKRWVEDIANKLKSDIERTVNDYCVMHNIEFLFSTNTDLIQYQNLPSA